MQQRTKAVMARELDDLRHRLAVSEAERKILREQLAEYQRELEAMARRQYEYTEE